MKGKKKKERDWEIFVPQQPEGWHGFSQRLSYKEANKGVEQTATFK